MATFSFWRKLRLPLLLIFFSIVFISIFRFYRGHELERGITFEVKGKGQNSVSTKVTLRLAKASDFESLLALRDKVVAEYIKPQVVDPAGLGLLGAEEENVYPVFAPEFYHNVAAGGFEAYRYWYESVFQKAFTFQDGWGLMMAIDQATQNCVGLLLFTTTEYPTKKVRGANDTAEIRYFIVDESMRGKGVGKAIVKAVVQYCLAKHPQIKRWEVEVMRWHNQDSIAAYEKMGFSPMEEKYNEVCLDRDRATGNHFHLLYELSPEKLMQLYGLK